MAVLLREAPVAPGPAAAAARHLLAYVWVEVLGHRASALARACGQTRGNISAAARKGAAHAHRWQAAIPQWCRGDEAE